MRRSLRTCARRSGSPTIWFDCRSESRTPTISAPISNARSMRSDGARCGESASELDAGWLAPGGTRAEPASRRWAPAAILFAMVVYLCGVPFAVSHLDFARDVGVAYGIATGQRWPLQGPALDENLHLGPVWYYLLAVPLRLTHSWLVTVLVVALIASLKFPLAYALGSRLVDPLFGVLWALLLALPGWNS